MSASAPVPPASPPVTSGGQFLVLVLRFIVGYGVLLACLLLLLRRPPWTLSPVDAVYWLVLGTIVVLHRLVLRSEDEIALWRSSALRHLGAGTVFWVACQSVHAIR